MDRRKVLLIVAAVIAALGTTLVFLYVKGADGRAARTYDAVQVLKAVKPITAGETIEAAQTAGAIQTGSVPSGDRLPDALTTLDGLSGKVANTTIYPGEQIIASKFGAASNGTALTLPKGKVAISVNLADPARVAGFVNPGNNVAIFFVHNTQSAAGSDLVTSGYVKMLLPSVEVIAVGTTTTVATTTTDPTGAQTTEQLPRTLLTLAVDQSEAQKVLFATGGAGQLAFGLTDKNSQVSQAMAATTYANLFK